MGALGSWRRAIVPKLVSTKEIGHGGPPTPHAELDNNYIAREAPPDPSPLPAVKRRAGAKPGNRNALRHGRYTAERRAWRARMNALLKGARTLLKDIREADRRIPKSVGP